MYRGSCDAPFATDAKPGELISVKDNLTDSAYITFLENGISLKGGRYLYTEQAARLVTDLNRYYQDPKDRDKCRVVLTGAKGVGKSCTLLFLASICTKSWVFVSSRSPDFSISCFREVKEGPPPVKMRKLQTKQPQLTLQTFYRMLHNTPGVHLFADLSEWSDSQQDLCQKFCQVLSTCLSDDIPTVVAHSSGRGSMAPRYVQNLRQHLTPILWAPFTRLEVKSFYSSHNFLCRNVETTTASAITVDDLIEVTNCNPKLLSRCSMMPDFRAMKIEVEDTVKEYIHQLLIERERDLCDWLQRELKETYDILQLAAQGQPSKCYRQCWGWKHNLMYIKSSTEEADVLGLSYPGELRHIFHFIRQKYRGQLPPPVHGFFFEYDLLDTVGQLNLVYIEKNIETVQYEIDFSVTGRLSGQPKKEVNMQPGCIYHLEYKTQSVDGVCTFYKDDICWLLLLQTSLSSYRNHKSKAGSAAGVGDQYKKHTGPNPRVMYVYLSPHLSSPHELIEAGVHSRTKELYLAVPRPKSLTASTIQFVVDRSRYLV